MSTYPAQLRPMLRPSVTQSGLIPDLGVASCTVALAAAIHWTALPLLGPKPPLVLFTVMAAALTFWRGLGPGMLASSLGTTVATSLFIRPFEGIADGRGNVPAETVVSLMGSMFICWLIYRTRAEHEHAEAANDRRNGALAFVAHELRTPLASVQLAATMLDRDRSGATRERAAQLILRSAKRLGKVVQDLVDVTRLEANTLRIDPSPLLLQGSILAAVDVVSAPIAERQQSLEIDVSPDPPLWMAADDLRLQQVFVNLLSNASRYSPEGAEISIRSRADEGRAVVVVCDTGIGIRRDMHERIFDPFVRESGPGAEGLGIGLTLVRRIITQHGGRITAHSEGLGRGSTFTIELPLLSSDSR